MVTQYAFTVIARGEPEDSLVDIEIVDESTLNRYDVYPEGMQAYCYPGAGNLRVEFRLQNVGAINGILYGRILSPGGGELYSNSELVNAGSIVKWTANLDMPPYNFGPITVEVSATPDYAVSKKVSFALASGVLPAELSLSVIATAALVIVDAVLIGYYLVTNMPKTSLL